jgi:hypothetical protein
MLTGCLRNCSARAVIRRADGYWHFDHSADCWEGPFNWVGPTGAGKKFPIETTRVAVWVARFGHLPDLPGRQPLPAEVFSAAPWDDRVSIYIYPDDHLHWHYQCLTHVPAGTHSSVRSMQQVACALPEQYPAEDEEEDIDDTVE